VDREDVVGHVDLLGLIAAGRLPRCVDLSPGRGRGEGRRGASPDTACRVDEAA